MKRLLLLILPASVGFALWLRAALEVEFRLVLTLCAPVFLGFAIQCAVLFLTHRGPKWLRLAPLGLLALPIALALSVSPRGFLWQLDVILWLMMAILYLLGWTAAWGLEPKHKTNDK